MVSLSPEDFKNNKIMSQSLIYIYRSRNKIIDECCGFWNFVNINEKNELIISSKHETWALEWYSTDKGGYGWFPYSNKDYHLKDVEYSVVLLDKKNKIENEIAHILHSLNS